MTSSGELIHRITIQQEGTVRDPQYGGQVPGWVEVDTVWASVSPLRGREYFAAQQVNAETTHQAKIRYRSGITPKMRFLFEGRVFGIEAVLDPQERHRELILMAVERVGESG